MKIEKQKNHTFELNDIDVKVIKIALEYFVMNAEEDYLCHECNTKLLRTLNLVTKIVDGKSLHEQMSESKKGGK